VLLSRWLLVVFGITLAARMGASGMVRVRRGQIWKAAEAAAHYKVDSLAVILDTSVCRV